MKQLAGLLVEYLVIGAVALIWIVPVLSYNSMPSIQVASISAIPSLLAFTLPAMYVVGMVCDFLGYRIAKLSKLGKYGKDGIKKKVWGDEVYPGSQYIHVYATCYEPKLAEEIEARSSRDRVARGAFVAFSPVLFFPPASLPFLLHLIITIFFLVVLSFMWHRYQKLSIKYELLVWKVLQDKHEVVSYKNDKLIT
ncbi:hypothetical protein FCL47_03915 [Desulfopila sp. IMCC35006]|uniref:hypothetical protein n=1 Tax=Desulfopila sp. IMCC35006 TaxID=2569542 RepID=UPI0010ACF31A|nr:hypothetical protein [Desulfopila sp. IMCC35006]TKB28636.1 hypothetical protein FCL47_03915 [Desulfopila sp. IMCC35006]